MTSTDFQRASALDRLRSESFDVLVVGGGITGAGVLLDAAARGLRAALVEKADFASGTSSRSSKLVHGGLRYLQQKEYRLVYQNLAERQRLLDNAPHLVSVLPFVIPLWGKDGVVSKAVANAYRSALWLYDLTGGVRIGKWHQRMSKEDALEQLPTLQADRLVAAFTYFDAFADDARLVVEVLRTAVLDHGAVAANYAEVTAFLHDAQGRTSGATLADGTEVSARVTVNATGVWTEELESLAGSRSHRLRPAKGVHITVPAAKLPARMAAVLPVPNDRRTIFVVPWGDHTFIGTTDTDYTGPLDDPPCTAEDVEYLLRAVNAWVTRPLEASDVVATWAGLRPLVRGESKERTADLSRRHDVTISPTGMVTITGGKLTTYRAMAADAVDACVRLLGHGSGKSPTRKLRLHGAAGYEEQTGDAEAALGLPQNTAEHLLRRYGADARRLAALITAQPDLAQPLVRGLPYLRAEALYAVTDEMAQNLDDILRRRTRAALLGANAVAGAADDVADLVAGPLGWDEVEAKRQVSHFVGGIDAERAAAGLT